MRATPEPRVRAWVARQAIRDLYITTITEAEIRVGIALLPEGRRRSELAITADQLFADWFAERILPFDSAAAQAYGAVAASRRAAGREYDTRDCLIASIARSYDAEIATRDLRGFVDCGIAITNPWGV